MGVVVSTLLKTNEPDDLKKVTDYIIEQTRVQSLKDTGSEWPLNQDVGSCDQGLIINEEGALWQDSSYYAKHLNIDELATNIARQFPDMEFTLHQWADNDPIGYSYLWNGDHWVEYEDDEWEECEAPDNDECPTDINGQDNVADTDSAIL